MSLTGDHSLQVPSIPSQAGSVLLAQKERSNYPITYHWTGCSRHHRCTIIAAKIYLCLLQGTLQVGTAFIMEKPQ